METKIFQGELERELEQAAELLRKGEVVAFPTETVYGLGGNAYDETAVRKIYEAKGRPSDNPLIAHIYDRKQLNEFTEGYSSVAEKLMDAFWPGPLTLILERKAGILPDCVTAGLETVAVRMPNHPIAKRLLMMAGVPIVAPSANLSGKPSPTTADHVIHDLSGRVAGIVRGGSCMVGVESTVVDVSGEKPVILRPGAVTREQMEELLGMEVAVASGNVADTETPQAPGMKYKHYAPEAPVYICTGTMEEIAEKIQSRLMGEHVGNIGVMVSRQTKAMLRGLDEKLSVDLGDREDISEITHNLFAALRYFDELGVDIIYTEEFSSAELGAALMNRLNKAAGNQRI